MTSFPCDLRLPRSFYGIWTSFFIAKIVAAFFLPPIDDEAYYWVWGRNAALGYFDHPGMIGWMNLLGLAPGFFRIPFIAISQLSVLVLAGAGREHLGFNEGKLLLVLLLFNLIPVTGPGTWLGLPDSPLILFWILSIHFSLRLLSNPADMLSAAMLGLSLGLGFCSKYHIVLAPLTLVLFCLFSHRAFFENGKAILIILVFGLAASFPTLFWNQQSAWISFQYQLRHGLETKAFNLPRVLAYVGGQILIMSPFLILAAGRLRSPNRNDLLVKYFAFVPLVFFLLSALRAPVQANWPSIAAPGLILAGVAFSERLARYAIGYFVAIYAVGAVVLLCVPSLLPNKAKEPLAMQTLVRETASLPILYGATYQISSQLWMQQSRPVFKPKGLSRFDMYDIWKQPSLPGRFHLAYKTSSGIPHLTTHLPNEDSNRSYGIYSVVEMVQQL